MQSAIAGFGTHAGAGRGHHALAIAVCGSSYFGHLSRRLSCRFTLEGVG